MTTRAVTLLLCTLLLSPLAADDVKDARDDLLRALRDVDEAGNDVRDRVSRIRGQLPREAEEPIVAKVDANAWPVELQTGQDTSILNSRHTIPSFS